MDDQDLPHALESGRSAWRCQSLCRAAAPEILARRIAPGADRSSKSAVGSGAKATGKERVASCQGTRPVTYAGAISLLYEQWKAKTILFDRRSPPADPGMTPPAVLPDTGQRPGVRNPSVYADGPRFRAGRALEPRGRGWQPTRSPPVLDAEATPTSPTCRRHVNQDEAIANMQVMLQEMERHYRKRPIIYTTVDFYEANLSNGALTDYPIWVRSTKHHPAVKYGSRAWHFWQYQSDGRVPGIGVDKDAFYGTREQWDAFLGSRECAPRRPGPQCPPPPQRLLKRRPRSRRSYRRARRRPPR